MPLHRVTRRALGLAAGAAAVVAAFTAGVLAAGGAAPEESRLDEAAARIEDDALAPVDREALDAAAITAMLRAAGDQWGQWQPPGAPVVRLRADAPRVGVRDLPGAAGPVTVVTVPAFDRGTGTAVREAVATLPDDAAGVVLDLRGNGGGLLDEAVDTASAFLDGGPVARVARGDGAVLPFDAARGGDTGTSLVVLVDSRTASAAEVVAGALRDRGRAVLVGTRTFGKGTVQEPSRLSDGSTLQLTAGSWTTPGGDTVEGVGLAPDVVVADPAAALDRAVAVLPGLLAGTGS